VPDDGHVGNVLEDRAEELALLPRRRVAGLARLHAPRGEGGGELAEPLARAAVGPAELRDERVVATEGVAVALLPRRLVAAGHGVDGELGQRDGLAEHVLAELLDPLGEGAEDAAHLGDEPAPPTAVLAAAGALELLAGDRRH
jgi:hypothetical protein